MVPAGQWHERSRELQACDGSRWLLHVIAPVKPRVCLLWIPALGVAARSYRRFAEAMAAHDVAVALHEWRGIGSSSVRAARDCDWGYEPLLLDDLPSTRRALAEMLPQVPLILGGHSLGGQFAALSAALDPAGVAGLALLAAGVPHPSNFPQPMRAALPVAFRLLPAIAAMVGYLPGRQLGFAGRESRGVIADWARTGRTGGYRLRGIPGDMDARLRALRVPVFGLHFSRDWLGPEAALLALVRKLNPSCSSEIHRMGSGQLGVSADHFTWMKHPLEVARLLGRWARLGGA